MAKKKRLKQVPPNPKTEHVVLMKVDPDQACNVAIGIDPSLTSTGYTVFNEETGHLYALGRVVTKSVPGYDYDDYRVNYISREILGIALEYGVAEASFEDQFGGANMKTTIQLVQVRTAIATLLSFHGVDCSYDSPAVIKHGLIQVNKIGTIKKEDIADLVVATYPGYKELVGPFSDKAGKSKTSDVYDSTSIAMHHRIKKQKLK